MLARKQRGRHYHRDLPAVHGGDEGSAQRHLCLTEAHVAADQPVHGPSGSEFVQDDVYGGLLVLRLLVGKAGTKLVVGSGLYRQRRRLAQLAFGGDLDQCVGNIANAALHAGLARLPGTAAEPIELDLRLFRAVAGQKLDVFDRQEQLVAAGVMDLEAVVRRAGRLDRAQPSETPDAVIDVHNEIAGGETRHLGDEILPPSCCPSRAHEPIAQNVLLADYGRLGGLEPAFDPKNRQCDV